jgi:pilus assembly protein Flp/PilA
MLSYIRKFAGEAKDRGASAVEYGLMVAAIAAVIVGIVFGLGTLVSGTFNDTCQEIAECSTQALPEGCDPADG